MARPPALTAEETIQAFLNEISTQSDRGAAIVAASVLDALLQKLILERLIPLGRERQEALFEGPNKPLSTFSSKIEILFALGILANHQRQVLHGIRDIRNQFAHRIEALTFADPEVEAILNRLASSGAKAKLTDPRKKFLGLFQLMAALLYGVLGLPNFRIRPIGDTHAAPLREMRSYLDGLIKSANEG